MDYKLKNRDGVETTYAKDKIKIPAATGDSMVVFTQGEAQAEKTVDINANGAFTVEPDAGYSFVKKVSGTVAVPTPAPVLQEKAVNITSNGQTSVSPDTGKDGLSKVNITVAVPTPTPALQEEKRATIVLAGLDDITPDSGFDYMGQVNAFVASEYAELQNPTGTMPTYEEGVVEFANEVYPVNSFVFASVAFNSMPNFANPPVTMWIKTASMQNLAQNCEIVLYAETSGTLTKEFWGAILGGALAFGDVVVSKGWNLVETNNGVMSVAAASTNEANTILGPIPLNPMPVFDLSAMDAYQKSFYKVGGIAYDAVSPNAESIVCGKTVAGVEGTATITSIIKGIIDEFSASQKGLVVFASQTPVSTFQHDSLIGAKDFLILPQVSKGTIAFVLAGSIYTVASIDGEIYGAMPKEGASISLDPSTGTITAKSDSGEAPTFWGTYIIMYM